MKQTHFLHVIKQKREEFHEEWKEFLGNNTTPKEKEKNIPKSIPWIRSYLDDRGITMGVDEDRAKKNDNE